METHNQCLQNTGESKVIFYTIKDFLVVNTCTVALRSKKHALKQVKKNSKRYCKERDARKHKTIQIEKKWKVIAISGK